MTCKNGTCADIYNDDREEDYIIERLSHIEEEIAYIKKILAHKRVKEQAMKHLKIEAEKEKKEEKKQETKSDSIQELINEIEQQLNEHKIRQVNTTKTYPRVHLHPWNMYTWF